MADVKNPTVLIGTQGTEEPKTFSANGEFFTPPGVKYNPITVNVPEAIHDTPLRITRNGEYEPDDDERYTPIVVDVRDGSVDDEPTTITENGFYRPEEGKRFNPLVVAVPDTAPPADEQKNITANGTYSAPDGVRYTPIVVNVPQYGEIEDEAKTITENGTYSPYEGKRFNPLTVAVPVPEDQTKTITRNGIYTPDEGKRFSSVEVSIPIMNYKNESVTENGTYTIEPDDIRYAGMEKVYLTVDVPDPPSEAHTYTDNGTFEVPEGKVYGPITVAVPIESGREATITENGTHTINPSSSAYKGMDSVDVTVDVPQYAVDDEEKTITSNGTYYPEEGKRFNPVIVDVPVPINSSVILTENGMHQPPSGIRWNPVYVNVGGIVDEAITITENGVTNVPSGKRYTPITVNVSGGGVVDEEKNITANGTYIPETGKRFNPVNVNVPQFKFDETMKELLYFWYDGIKNQGIDSPHSYSAEYWKDISGRDRRIDLNFCTWGNDHVSFDGELSSAKEHNAGIFNNYTLEIALKLNQSNSDMGLYATGASGSDVYASFIKSTFLLKPDNTAQASVSNRVGVGATPVDVSADITGIATGVPFVLTVSFYGGALNTYINGTFVSTNYAYMESVSNHLAYMFIGVQLNSSQTSIINLFNGDIYSIRCWSSILPDYAINQLANETMTRFGIGGQT